MNLVTNPFLKAIRSGEKQIGLWVSLGSNFAAEAIARSGFDWVLLDMEHCPSELDAILSQLQVFEAADSTPIVRPDWNDSVKVKRILDIGALGLLFPMIQSVEEAEAAVASTRYPPRGIRGVSTSTRANAFGRVTDYFDRVEDETAIIVQLETQSAISQAEEIAAVDGVSGVFFGPADIGADIGKLGKPMDPAVWDVILPAAKRLMDQGVPVGTLVADPDFAAKLFKEGFTFVACGADLGLLVKGADNLLATMKSKLS
ncbi:MAG: HpcH/HpaI aldolase family protein [Hyphomicrobiales bacterium]